VSDNDSYFRVNGEAPAVVGAQLAKLSLNKNLKSCLKTQNFAHETHEPNEKKKKFLIDFHFFVLFVGRKK
jgi:hypothetical protein